MSGSSPTVGSSSSRMSGRVMNAATRATFCRLPLEYDRTRRFRSRSSRSTNSVRRATSTPPDMLPSNPKVSAPVSWGHSASSPGNVAHRPVRAFHVPDPDACQPCLPGRRTQEPEQEPDGRRLPGPVRPEKPEDLPRGDLVELVELQAQPVAVVRGRVTEVEIPDFLDGVFSEVIDVLAGQSLAPAGPPFARYTPVGDGSTSRPASRRPERSPVTAGSPPGSCPRARRPRLCTAATTPVWPPPTR